MSSQYFTSRAHAGWFLAQQLAGYRYENCAVVALSDGAVQVGEQIAAQLHCVLTMLLMEDIEVPGENTLFGTVNEQGGFTYNQMFSTGEVEAYYDEFHGYLEDQKREKFQKMNRLLGDGGLISEDLLRDHVVVIVSDGLSTGASLDAVMEFLKPVRTQKLIMVAPIASVQAVDRMHVLADELHVLSVTDNYLDTNHYYEQNDVPSHEDTVAKINQIILNWK
jgi:putative phosphoribosyl transferase